MKKRLLTIKETAETLNVSPRTVRRLIEREQAELQALKVGGCLRITRESVDLYIDKEVAAFELHNGVEYVPKSKGRKVELLPAIQKKEKKCDRK